MASQELEDEERATLEDLVGQAVAIHLLRVLVLEPLKAMLLSNPLPPDGWVKAQFFKGGAVTAEHPLLARFEAVVPRKRRPDPLGCAR